MLKAVLQQHNLEEADEKPNILAISKQKGVSDFFGKFSILGYSRLKKRSRWVMSLRKFVKSHYFRETKYASDVIFIYISTAMTLLEIAFTLIIKYL